MKVLSASLFIALGLAIGTAISAIAAASSEGGQHLAAHTAGTEYAHVMEQHVMEHEAIAGLEETSR